jgi:hypothetical protein
MSTTSSGGYSPKHLVAIWIENSTGTFIKTKVKYSSSSNYDHLGNWTGKSAQNTVDATTGATLNTHGTVTFTWNGTNVAGAQVADGIYKVWVEMAWASSLTTGKTTTSFSFTKGTSPDHQTPANLTNFANITLDWVPAGNPLTLTTNAITGSPFCAGSPISIGFSIASGTVNAGNIFTAQLSDASGSFSSPVNIGTLTGTTSGSINGMIPASASTGSAYRIRITSSNPSATASDNGTNLTINSVTPVSISNNSGVLTSTASTGNQWYNQSSGVISGATAQTYTPTSSGNYYTIVTDLHGCLDTSNVVNVVINSVADLFNEKNIFVYPNPTNGIINIRSNLNLNNCTIRVESIKGNKVLERKLNLSSGVTSIDLGNNSSGVYYITLSCSSGELKYRIVLNKP